jgi:hypothetical protein
MKIESYKMTLLFSEDYWKMLDPLRFPRSLIALRAFPVNELLRLPVDSEDGSPIKSSDMEAM